MNRYDLIAFDMDGTLLDSNHQITQNSLDAIDTAVNAGKIVILSTGRSLSELKDYRHALKNVRYFICESGALLVDTNSDQIIHSEQIEPSAVREIIKIASPEQAMIYIASNGQNLATRSYVMRMNDFCIGQYQDIFLQTGTLLDDVVASYNKEEFPIEKLNLFSATPKLREYFVQALSHLPLEMARAEETSLELSPKNVSKGSGLLKLCEYLSLPVERTIAVGDSDNDMEVLKTAGLSVAMGNARPYVKELSDVIVADNNHGGCAEAIYKYLLNE